MTDQQKPKPTPIVPAQFQTAHASQAPVFHAAGQFVVSFYDERLVTGPDGNLAPANFEVARYAMGPLTALWLANNLLNALKDYADKFGPLPKALVPLAPGQLGDVIASLEEMIKQSRQPPPDTSE